MSLDLFFVPKKPTFEQLRAEDFVPTAAMTRARRKLVSELIGTYPPARIEGEVHRGRLEGFPIGEMNLWPGCLHWSLHGVEDSAPVQEVVDWFHTRGWICEDPQDAGFGNRERKHRETRTALASFDELQGAEFVGLRLLREWARGIAFDWVLADGSQAMVQFVHFQSCRLPDIGGLLTQRVQSVHFETGDFDTLRASFTGDHELLLEGAVFHKSVVIGKVKVSG